MKEDRLVLPRHVTAIILTRENPRRNHGSAAARARDDKPDVVWILTFSDVLSMTKDSDSARGVVLYLFMYDIRRYRYRHWTQMNRLVYVVIPIPGRRDGD